MLNSSSQTNSKQKVAWITGGTRIGKTVAEHLASHGFNVVLSYHHSQNTAFQTQKRIHSLGAKALIIKCDMTKDKQVRQCVSSIRKKFGRLDCLIHMASIYKPIQWKNLDEKQWDKIGDSNLKSSFLAARHATSLMKKGKIIFFSDWTATSGRPRYKNFIPYYAAKKGVIGLTEALALELAPHIHVNAIAPGPILPPAHSSKKLLAQIKKETPLNKMGNPLDIAKAVQFFLESNYVTGECLQVDGGRHLL